MNLYILRSVKYIVKLVVLVGLILGAMLLTKTTNIDPTDLLSELFVSKRGLILVLALLVVAGTYPLFGFVKREVSGDFENNTDAIVNTMAMSGYTLHTNEGGVMTFRANSGLKRLLALWDDQIVVSGDRRTITIEGGRKEVVKAEYRLKSLIHAN